MTIQGCTKFPEI